MNSISRAESGQTEVQINEQEVSNELFSETEMVSISALKTESYLDALSKFYSINSNKAIASL